MAVVKSVSTGLGFDRDFSDTSGFIINSPKAEECSRPGGAHPAPGTRQRRKDNTTQAAGFRGYQSHHSYTGTGFS